MSTTVIAAPTPSVDASPGPAASCAVITPESLRDGAALAFEATVDRIEGDQVYMDVDTRYVGDVAEVVRIPQQPSDLPSEMTPGAFVVGTSYLLSITPDGYIAACGQSGPATDELRAIYDEAFTPR